MVCKHVQQRMYTEEAQIGTGKARMTKVQEESLKSRSINIIAIENLKIYRSKSEQWKIWQKNLIVVR